MTTTDKLGEAGVRLTKMANQLDENAANAERMMALLQPEFDAFNARTGHNVYVVRDYVDHMNAAKRQRQEASDIRELLTLNEDYRGRRYGMNPVMTMPYGN